MIIEKIKSANLEAMKNKDANLRGIYSIIINKFMQASIEARTSGKDVGDDELVKIIQKTIKELEEESANYLKAGNKSESEKIIKQKAAIEIYLPKMLSEQDIYNEIASMSDKSIPSVMRGLKAKYGNLVDLKIAQQILKNFN